VKKKSPRPISSGGTAHATALKYHWVDFLGKELYRQRKSVLFLDIKFIEILLFSIILFVFKRAP